MDRILTYEYLVWDQLENATKSCSMSDKSILNSSGHSTQNSRKAIYGQKKE
jgi:hypothetical protein